MIEVETHGCSTISRIRAHTVGDEMKHETGEQTSLILSLFLSRVDKLGKIPRTQ
jgi:hypothetical protein